MGSPTNLPNLANPSTNSRRPSVPSMLSETNSKLPSKKPKLLSNPRKPRFFASKSKSLNPNKTLSDVLLRRTKKSTTLDAMDNVPSNPCKPLLTLKSAPVVKPSESRRRWNLTSTTSKSNSATPTDNAPKPRRPLSLSKDKTRISKSPSTTHNAPVKILLNKLLLLTDAPTCSNPNWKKCAQLSNKPSVAANWPSPSFLRLTNVVASSTLRTLP